MTSAVLASRNEPCWGEPKVYMRKYTNNSINNPHLISRFNPYPNPSRQNHDSSSKPRDWQSDEPSPRSLPPPASVSSPTLNLRKESSHGGFVTFHLGAYTTRELKELRKRLFSEVEQVRTLINRIDELHRSHFHGSFGGDREALLQPSPLQLNHAEILPGGKEEKKKKKKNISGKKRALPFSSACRDPKRPAVSDSSRIGELVTSMMRRCGQILTKLMKQKYSWVFNKPVDTVALKLPDYRQVIRHPMDLGTVKLRLSKNEYGSPLEFASDVRLTFNNALTYNPKGQDVHTMAETLLSRFDDMFNPAYRKFEAEYQRAVAAEQANQKVWAPSPNILLQERSSPDPVPVQVQQVTAAPVPMPAAPTVKLPKLKAKESTKRQMSFEEKAKLGISLQNTPPERMDQLMQIIKKRNSHLAKDEDEIELDIETIDNETLWELDRFVSYNKKAMNKTTTTTMRAGPPISNSTSAAQINKSPVIEMTPEAAVQKNKKVDVAEEDVDIGEEIPIHNFPPVEIEKDVVANNASSRSSSSSSSSSGSDSSSSSGSDSASSSGSDSDADSAQSPLVESREPAPCELKPL